MPFNGIFEILQDMAYKNCETYLSLLRWSSTTCSTIFMHDGITFMWIKIKRAKVPYNGIFGLLQYMAYKNCKP